MICRLPIPLCVSCSALASPVSRRFHNGCTEVVWTSEGCGNSFELDSCATLESLGSEEVDHVAEGSRERLGRLEAMETTLDDEQKAGMRKL